MGSCLSKQKDEVVALETIAEKPAPQPEVHEKVEEPPKIATSFEEANAQAVALLSTLQSQTTAPRLSGTSSSTLNDYQSVPWKLDEEEIETKHTFKTLEKIKETTCTEFGILKGRIALIDTVKGWFSTPTGAFSPGNFMAGSVPKTQYDSFQKDRDNSVLTIPNMRENPEYANRPAVKHRPHMTFRSGLLLVSTLTEVAHPLGYLFVWDSKPHGMLTDEQTKRFEELAVESVDALQESMLQGIDAVELAAKRKQGGAPVELPAVWIDLHSPEWRVIGVNEKWEMLTGVGLSTFVDHLGLLSIMGNADGSPNVELKEAVQAAIAEVPSDRSIPVILSPRAPIGASLQFAAALKRATGPPPLPAANVAPAVDLWMVEVHVRIQADTHKGVTSSRPSVDSVGPANQYNRSLSANSTASNSNPSGNTSHPSGNTGSVGPVRSSAGSGGAMPVSEALAGVPPRMANLQFGQVLGAGSYADVYAGFLGERPVAIKVIEIPGVQKRKKDWGAHYEALLAVDIHHENVVQTYDFCRIEEPRGTSTQVWIVQELCDRGSISSAIEDGSLRKDYVPDGEPNMHAIMETAREISRGMAYLHDAGEVHADLTANNVLLSNADNGRGFVAKVTDFGMGRLAGSVQTTKTFGTVNYMPPECLLEGIMSKAGDVYAFGAMMWEMYTGTRAWKDMNHTHIIFAVSVRDEKLKFPESTPEGYAALAMQCMASDPNERPTFDEINKRLDELMAELSNTA